MGKCVRGVCVNSHAIILCVGIITLLEKTSRPQLKCVIISLLVVLLAVAAGLYLTHNPYQLSLHRSVSLPRKPENFVGREKELMDITNVLEFSTSGSHLISIVGGPGFGKSALAVSAAHELLSRGVTVYYVDMVEVSSMQALAKKVIEGDEGIVTKSNTVQRLHEWARQLQYNSLLLLDNCDEMLNEENELEELQKLIKKLLKFTKYLKILTTSRQRMELSEFKQEYIALRELEVHASCTLIKYYYSSLTDIQCHKVGDLTGNVPLAIKVVGSLLEQPNPPYYDEVIERLNSESISFLSHPSLPVDERISACISLSYQYLSADVKAVGHCLANFPRSFSLDAALGVCFELKNTSSIDVRSAVVDLVKRSLLQENRLADPTRRYVDRGADRYEFHLLIREFFRETNKYKPDYFDASFIHYFSEWSLKVPVECETLCKSNSQQCRDPIFQEQHNLLLFINILRNPNVLDPDYVFQGIQAVNHLNSIHLYKYMSVAEPKQVYTCHCRLTPHCGNSVVQLRNITVLEYIFPVRELNDSMWQMVNYLENNCNFINNNGNCSISYISLVVQLATIEEVQNRTFHAITLLQTHRKICGDVLTYKEFGTACLKVFNKLATYFEALGYCDLAKYYHGILQSHILLGCHSSFCDNVTVGVAYYNLGNMKYSIKYLKLALKKNDIKPLTRAKILLTLYQANFSIQERNETSKLITNLIPNLINLSNALFRENFELMSEVLNYESLNNYDVKAFVEKQLTVLHETGPKMCNKEDIQVVRRAISLLKWLYDNSEYDECVKIANFAQIIIQQALEEPQLVAAVWDALSICHFCAGNCSKAVDSANIYIEYFYQQHQPYKYTNAFVRNCLLVIVGHDLSLSCGLPQILMI